MRDTRIKISLPEDMLAEVDEQRGLVPRQRWLQEVIKERLDGDRVPVAPVTASAAKVSVQTTPSPDCPGGWDQAPGRADCRNCGRTMTWHRKAGLL
jgi:hypothetical protein